MRYALTIQAGSWWNSINTLIIEDGLAEGECQEPSWKDGGEELVAIISRCGYSLAESRNIVNNGLYFIVVADDVDFCLTDTIVDTDGVEKSFEEYKGGVSQ